MSSRQNPISIFSYDYLGNYAAGRYTGLAKEVITSGVVFWEDKGIIVDYIPQTDDSSYPSILVAQFQGITHILFNDGW